MFKTSRKEIPSLNTLAAATGVPVYAVENKKKLEDYFFKLTQHG